MQPSLLAYLALAGFLPVAIYLFSRLPRETATAVVILAGSVLLPEWLAFDFPVIPPFDKERITYASALIGALIFQSRSLSAARPGFGPEALVGVFMIANIATILTNPSPMWDEGRLEPGLSAYDIVSGGADEILTFATPFFLGRAMFPSRSSLRTLMICLGAAGFGYGVLILVEVVVAIPFHVFQLSKLLYNLAQQASFRWGVVQPTVFMDHGLSLATWMASCALAAAALARVKLRVYGLKPRLVWILSWVGLLLSRNVAGVLYGTALSAAITWLSAKNVARISVLLAVIVCGYPALRATDIFPDDQLVEWAAALGKERQDSLWGRFADENFVLDLMEDRIWFGWGNISRVPGAEGLGGWQAGGFEGGIDGYWAIRLGTHGALGLELRLIMLILPVITAWRALDRVRVPQEKILLVSLMAIVSMRCVDLLANGWWNNLPVFLSGALYGIARSYDARGKRVRPTPGPDSAGTPAPRPR